MYVPWRNPRLALGFLWGLPLPLVSLGVDSWVSGRFSPALFLEHPFQILLLLCPFVSAAFFGALGTVRKRRDLRIARLIEKLELRISELALANDKLKDVEQLKARFMANVTHDLKSPLVAIRGYNESILEERFGPVTDKQREGLSVAVRNIDRLQLLIKELLEFERIDGGECKLSLSDFDLTTLLQEIVNDFQPVIDRKRLRMRLQIADAPEVHADRVKISRVLVNLISNALKFSPEQAAIRISTCTNRENRRVLVAIEDLGPGIPTAAQMHLFSRYWQPENGVRPDGGGTGLGLAICKGILDAHGSTIQVRSAKSEGTTVRFDLPLSEPQVPAAQPQLTEVLR